MNKNRILTVLQFSDFRFYEPNSTLQIFTFSCKFLPIHHIKLNKNICKFLQLNFLCYARIKKTLKKTAFKRFVFKTALNAKK